MAERETECNFENFSFFVTLRFVLHVKDNQELAVNKIQSQRRISHPPSSPQPTCSCSHGISSWPKNELCIVKYLIKWGRGVVK